MRYNNGSNAYLNSVVNDLRDVRYTWYILYTSSLDRAKREGISRPAALINNLRDFYNNGLGSLLVPVGVSVDCAVYKSQYATRLPTVFLRQGDNLGQDDGYLEPEKKRKRNSEGYYKKNRKNKLRVRRRRVRMRRLGRAK